jgi:hypothetical protein
VRGVRPIERAVKKGNDDEAAIRSSGCLPKANASGKSTWSLTIVPTGCGFSSDARFILEFGDFGISMLMPSQFITARAGSRHMVRLQEGVILFVTAVPARGAPNSTATGSA